MEYSIHRLNAEDIDTIVELNHLFGDVFEDNDNYVEDIPSNTYLASFLSSDNHVVLVSKNDEKVVGGLVAYVLTKFEKERKELYIYDLAVSRDFQRKGIGRALIEELKVVARNMDAYVIFVQADEGDDAVKFYESLQPDENIRSRNFDFTV